jgi:hypothetical protein
MTRYAQVFFGDAPATLPTQDWKPWINSDGPRERFAMMVLRRAIRDRGGVQPSDPPMDVHVYVAEPDDFRNGHPRRCHQTTYRVKAD